MYKKAQVADARRRRIWAKGQICLGEAPDKVAPPPYQVVDYWDCLLKKIFIFSGEASEFHLTSSLSSTVRHK